MTRGRNVLRWVMALVLAEISLGCATETAYVRFSYVVEPTQGLPQGMKTIAVEPAKVGPTTDAKWSDLCATLLQSLVNESRTEFGTDIAVSDRRDTQVTFDEADLAAAGMSTDSGGGGGRLLAAQGKIVSNVNVKVETEVGHERTITGIDISALRGHYVRGGRAAIQTGEVETVSRHMTVQTDFRLIDTANNKAWDQMSATHRSSEATHASPFFGSSRTAAVLTREDAIIGTLVERAAREFISRLMPCRITVDTDIKSSTNARCMEGVRMLRAEAYDDALSLFKAALAEDGGDHRAAYGAGLASEAVGRVDEALAFYRRACAGSLNREYMAARDRAKAYAGRVRR
ncbi:MAG: tetratricopeptide repeat protein [Phycisphaerae bacterium]